MHSDTGHLIHLYLYFFITLLQETFMYTQTEELLILISTSHADGVCMRDGRRKYKRTAARSVKLRIHYLALYKLIPVLCFSLYFQNSCFPDFVNCEHFCSDSSYTVHILSLNYAKPLRGSHPNYWA